MTSQDQSLPRNGLPTDLSEVGVYQEDPLSVVVTLWARLGLVFLTYLQFQAYAQSLAMCRRCLHPG